MRIVYHHRTRSTDAQGIHILEIVKAFEEVGHTVEVVSLVNPARTDQDAKRDAAEAGWKKLVRRIPWGYDVVQLGYNLLGIPMLALRLFRRRPDFIYERYSLFNFTGVVAARIFGIPIILEVNSPLALEQKREGDIGSYRLAAWSERVICNAASKVIVVSTPLRRMMLESGVASEKLVLMPNGVNRGRFAPNSSSAELRAQLGLEDKTVIGFVGWFRKWHGIELLLEAFHQAGLGPRGSRLMLIGDGPAMPDLRAYVQLHGLEPFVIFTGPLPHQAVPPYLSLIDIAVQPAANEYCCPMKILEYMGVGKPIVAPRQENIEELVQDGYAGVLFAKDDTGSMAAALTRMASDREAARRMGQHGLETIEKRELLWTANARRVVEIAASLARRRN